MHERAVWVNRVSCENIFHPTFVFSELCLYKCSTLDSSKSKLKHQLVPIHTCSCKVMIFDHQDNQHFQIGLHVLLHLWESLTQTKKKNLSKSKNFSQCSFKSVRIRQTNLKQK